MVSVYDLGTVSSWLQFAAWLLAVCAAAKAMFGSFLSAELRFVLMQRDAPRRQRLTRLNWEITNRAKWSEDLVRGSQHAAPVSLTPDELAERSRELAALSRSSRLSRALEYFGGCWACQTFWSALLLYAIAGADRSALAAVLSSLTYSGAAVLLVSVTPAAAAPPTGTPTPAAPCKGCK